MSSPNRNRGLFEQCIDIADVAERAVMEHYEAQGYNVIDVRDNYDDRRRDVDFYRVRDGETVGIDVKVDSHAEYNFFLEDMVYHARNGVYIRSGCFWRSRAEEWVYVFSQTERAYVLPLPELQRHVAERYEGLRRVDVKDFRTGQETWTYSGLLLPVRPTVQALKLSSFLLSDLQYCNEG